MRLIIFDNTDHPYYSIHACAISDTLWLGISDTVHASILTYSLPF